MKKFWYTIIILIIGLASFVSVASLPIDNYWGIVVYFLISSIALHVINIYLYKQKMVGNLDVCAILLSYIIIPVSYRYNNYNELFFTIPLLVILYFFVARSFEGLLLHGINLIVIICSVVKYATVFWLKNISYDGETIGVGNLFLAVMILWSFVLASISLLLKKDKQHHYCPLKNANRSLKLLKHS